MTAEKFNIILADPPWPCNSAKKHYRLMTVHEIRGLPVADIAAGNCSLFLWVTSPNLPHAFGVIEAWGFSYITIAFVWVKRNKASPGYFLGMGQWTRSNAEICLFAVKGKPKRESAAVRQIIDAPVEIHSKKPDETRDRIIQLLGDLPRVELFARQSPPGWAVWGNEVNSTIALS